MVSIQIIGAGAIGSFLAASFVEVGYDVSVVVRGARGDHLRQFGISLERNGRQDTATVTVCSSCDAIKRPDIVVLCTKSQDIESALDLLETYRHDQPILVTVQNGVDAPAQVGDRFPHAPVLAARVHGFFELNGGRVRHVGVMPSLCFGPWDGRSDAAVQLFSKVLTASGINNFVSADIRCDLWEKLMLASSIGSVGAALAIPVGQVMGNEVGRHMLEAAMREVAALALSRGIQLPDRSVESTLEFVASFPPDATSSPQRDLEAQKPSEFGQLTGAIVRMAKSESLDVPVHRQLIVRLAERGLVAFTK